MSARSSSVLNCVVGVRGKLEKRLKSIPVIDLFAGPGGLSEGFSSVVDDFGKRRFDVKVSIEKDRVAHQTLTLRSLFRFFPKGEVPHSYYNYIRGEISRDEFFGLQGIQDALSHARKEARLAELGTTPSSLTDEWISEALGGTRDWALIGGPPCQAYSIAGRARMGANVDFKEDKRHFLYKEYLRIIEKFRPAVFIMENVKGMLTSQHGGSPIFDRIIADLKDPASDLSYRIRSLVVEDEDVNPQDFVIEAEKYGIPQRRHRVILFGIRSDVALDTVALAKNPARFKLRQASGQVSIRTALAGLPAIRSYVSRKNDSLHEWRSILKNSPQVLCGWEDSRRRTFELAMKAAARTATAHESSGAAFIEMRVNCTAGMPKALADWYHDPKILGTVQHEARGHMASDLHRYLFAACFAASENCSPRIHDFPQSLLPEHANINGASVPFVDRFRVQLADEPSTTVTSHISKDGHYYIHFDPSQCRSLTVREAARLQTFPDNYFFEGGRTMQFHQVGNAVPPLLARQIAEVVSDFLTASGR